MGQFGALLNKNFIVWRRNRCGCICELATTIVFALFFILIGRTISETDKDPSSYLPSIQNIGVTAATPGADFIEKQKANIAALMANKVFKGEIMK
jgi:hypothetical protein